MKNKNAEQSPPLAARMIEDETAERAKKRLRDMGLIVNAGVGKTAQPLGEKRATKK